MTRLSIKGFKSRLIVVTGHPVSIQGNSKAKNYWKGKVATEAKKACSSLLIDQDLVITITYYYDGKPKFDVDNICKPICDALNGIVYLDDKQLVERHARLRSLEGRYYLKGVPPEVAIALTIGKEFVSIQVTKLGSGIGII